MNKSQVIEKVVGLVLQEDGTYKIGIIPSVKHADKTLRTPIATVFEQIINICNITVNGTISQVPLPVHNGEKISNDLLFMGCPHAGAVAYFDGINAIGNQKIVAALYAKATNTVVNIEDPTVKAANLFNEFVSAPQGHDNFVIPAFLYAYNNKRKIDKELVLEYTENITEAKVVAMDILLTTIMDLFVQGDPTLVVPDVDRISTRVTLNIMLAQGLVEKYNAAEKMKFDKNVNSDFTTIAFTLLDIAGKEHSFTSDVYRGKLTDIVYRIKVNKAKHVSREAWSEFDTNILRNLQYAVAGELHKIDLAKVVVATPANTKRNYEWLSILHGYITNGVPALLQRIEDTPDYESMLETANMNKQSADNALLRINELTEEATETATETATNLQTAIDLEKSKAANELEKIANKKPAELTKWSKELVTKIANEKQKVIDAKEKAKAKAPVKEKK